MLQASARDADAALLAALVPEILADHQRMDADWLIIKSQLDSIVNGLDGTLSAPDVARFCDAYTAHMEKEEAHIAPMAKRLFSAAQMAELGAAMQRRRGIAPSDASSEAAHGARHSASRRRVSAAAGGAGQRRRAGRPAAATTASASLSEADVLDDPIAQFAKWFDEAVQAQVNEPNAMSVATVDADGKPSSRIVLIKQYDARGFTWYTNYESQKGRQLRANPHAALAILLERGGTAGAHRGHGREDVGRGQRQVFLQPAAEKPAGGDRVAAERDHRRPRADGGQLRGRRGGRRRRADSGPSTGAATAWCRSASSSGRAGVRASMTASCSCGRRTAAGRWSVCSPDQVAKRAPRLRAA